MEWEGGRIEVERSLRSSNHFPLTNKYTITEVLSRTAHATRKAVGGLVGGRRTEVRGMVMEMGRIMPNEQS